MDNEGFIYVSYSKARRRKRQPKQKKKLVGIGDDEDYEEIVQSDSMLGFRSEANYDKETALRKVLCAVTGMETSEYFKTSVETIREILSTALSKSLEDTCRIVCYGLGSLCKMSKSIEQFAYMVCIQRLLKVPIEFFDPVFTSIDREIISDEFQFDVLDINEEGRRTVNELTLFYLPHCEHELTNGLLYANWSPLNLQNCIIIGNGFTMVLEHLIFDEDSPNWKKFGYIKRAESITSELHLKNNFSFYDVFNDLSVHVFPISKVNEMDNEFWDRQDEPEPYNPKDNDFF